VARQTRSQRRARREAQEQSKAAAAQPSGAAAAKPSGAGVAQRSRSRQAQVRPSQQPQKSQSGSQRPRGGARGFIAESWAELKKVEWPGQSQVIQATVVVLIACIVVGAFLWVCDQIWKPVVQWIIGQ
jgi:preprotein translocase subunit SecE